MVNACPEQRRRGKGLMVNDFFISLLKNEKGKLS